MYLLVKRYWKNDLTENNIWFNKPNKGEIIIGDQNLNKLSQPYFSIFRRGIG